MKSLGPLSVFRHAPVALLAAFLAIAAPFAAPTRLLAQGTVNRVVQGKVTDKAGAPVKGAIVYLKDDHTLAVKSAVTVDDGSYRFGQLAQGTDYEIWAAEDGKKSGTKNISSFDTRPLFDIPLKIDK